MEKKQFVFYRKGTTFQSLEFFDLSQAKEFLKENPDFKPIQKTGNSMVVTKDFHPNFFDKEYEFTCGCGEITKIKLHSEDLYEYNKGYGMIQDCFPYLNKEQRESIKTHMCHKCQMMMFYLNYDENGNLINPYF